MRFLRNPSEQGEAERLACARGQRGGMYGRALGNVTARVRKREEQKTNWGHFPPAPLFDKRRFIVGNHNRGLSNGGHYFSRRAFLHRQPRKVFPKDAQRPAFKPDQGEGTCIHTHTHANPRHEEGTHT